MNEEEKERLIKKDILSIENRVRHAFNQGYEMGLKERKNTCEDAISRQEAVEAFQMFREYESNRSNKGWVNRIETVLNQLPSVNPQHTEAEIQKMQELEQAEIQKAYELGKAVQPKTGHWIMPVQDDGMSDPIYYQVRCSKCGFDLDPQTWHMELHQYGADKYCPKCGAKMVEPREGEG